MLYRLLCAGLLLLALLIVLTALSQLTVMADCAASSESGQLASADLVALGTVEGVEVFSRSSLVKIRLEQIFKGSRVDKVSVRTDIGSQQVTSVDVPFEEGERYLLYLNNRDKEYITSTCAGTREMPGALPSETKSILGEGRPPESSQRNSEDLDEADSLPSTGGFVSLSVFTGLFLAGTALIAYPMVRLLTR